VRPPDIAQQIADLDKQIADVEARIFQHQKRVENLLARGAGADELKSQIATLVKKLADLETHKNRLEYQARSGLASR
jgi:hypothetical protein